MATSHISYPWLLMLCNIQLLLMTGHKEELLGNLENKKKFVSQEEILVIKKDYYIIKGREHYIYTTYSKHSKPKKITLFFKMEIKECVVL